MADPATVSTTAPLTRGDRIRAARKQRGWTQGQLGEALGVSSQAVSQWEQGRTDPEIDRLQQAADLLGVQRDWLTSGLGPDRSEAQGPAPVIAPFAPAIVPGADLVGARDFPIYAAAQGGEGHLIVTFDPIEVVKRPAILEGVKGAYGIMVYGDSMSPAYRWGDMALINPHMQPARDEVHVFYDHGPNGEAEAIIKNLISWNDRMWKLEQFRPEKQFDVARVDWPICHRVVGKYNRR
ncbi:XRE family transcriptional regulator [Phreatobacter stygius]|uniref:Helix-turn-helix transcriptional regulator n=1 Tax=Phreatobacter stygius TaxID=1940610 RepID=A0A4D7B9K2_9HYPH|nr:XRE family transcriptional regulator [Phreatobacter stygius]QCI67230.1 helix-turn-helix transcriptional regulator [Phreatobacter stygius]